MAVVSDVPQASTTSSTTGPSALEGRETLWAPVRRPGNRPPILTAKDVLWLLYLYPLRALTIGLSDAGRRRLGRCLEPIMRFVARKRLRVARHRMTVALGPSAGDIDSIARRYVSNAVTRGLDDFLLADARARRRLAPSDILGLDHLQQALSAGKGVILISGHFYANRLGKHFLAESGRPVLSVRHGHPPDKWMGRLGAGLQQRYVSFLHGIIRDEVFIGDPECALKIMARLRTGGLVNVHIDAAATSNWIDVPFFGHPRRFATGLLTIVRLSGCAVVPMVCLGTASCSRVLFDAPLRLEPARTREEFVSANIGLLAATLERQVREHPSEWEQWVRL